MFGNKGAVEILAPVVAGVLAVGAFYFFSSSLVSSRRHEITSEHRVYASRHAAELLELFRSLTSTQMRNYLSQLHVAGQTVAYPLCAHINLIDRLHSPAHAPLLLNPDPVAALPAPNPLDGPTSPTQANRFYQVQIVDVTSMAPLSTHCGNLPASHTLTGNERYQVTVGVTWVPSGKPVEEAVRTTLSTVIADPT